MRRSKVIARSADLPDVKRMAPLLAVVALCGVAAGDSPGAASNYPTPLHLRSTASSVAGSWVLGAGSGPVDSTTSNVSINNASDGGWYVFGPGAQSTTRLASIPTAPSGTGWIVD